MHSRKASDDDRRRGSSDSSSVAAASSIEEKFDATPDVNSARRSDNVLLDGLFTQFEREMDETSALIRRLRLARLASSDEVFQSLPSSYLYITGSSLDRKTSLQPGSSADLRPRRRSESPTQRRSSLSAVATM